MQGCILTSADKTSAPATTPITMPAINPVPLSWLDFWLEVGDEESSNIEWRYEPILEW